MALSCFCSAIPATTTDSDLRTRISVGASTGRLDLSDCGLVEVPNEVYNISDLIELSLAGNHITNLSDDIQNLKNLQKLGLAGNALKTLPAGIGELKQLQGLWVQGNLLNHLPSQMGQLQELRTLGLAGNQLKSLPPTLNHLKKLQVLSLAGNNLIELPEGFEEMSSLRVLALYGNYLTHLPESLTKLSSLEELWLQGNFLESLPSTLNGLVSLKQLSVADNHLNSLSDSVGGLSSLESLSLYGNNLNNLPPTLRELRNLQSIWIENNPFQLDSLHHSPVPESVKAFGVSSSSTLDVFVPPPELQRCFRVSQVEGTGNAASHGGYFKLQKYNENKPGWNDACVVAVAFGSAPAVPNWGGLLTRVRKEMEASGTLPAFDILYVVDSWRSWYTRCKKEEAPESPLGSYYRKELEAALESYKRVIMLGDSMGASAALLFSPLATKVVAFCPQVDLQMSSIRPGREAAWLQEYKKSLLGAVDESKGEILVHCGSWSHDCLQASYLPRNKVITKVHNVNNHRLAKEMDSRGSLVALIRGEIEKEMSRC